VFSRSLGVKTYHPRFCIFCMPVPDSDLQYVHFFFFHPHTVGIPAAVCLIVNMWALRLMWPANSPTASGCLLLEAFFFLLKLTEVHLLGSWTGDNFYWSLHLFRCSCTKWLLITSLHITKELQTVWLEEAQLVPSLANVSASSFPGIPWRPGIRTKVTLLEPLSFSSACMLSHTRADSLVVIASAAIDTLLSEQIRILLLFSFLGRSSSVYLRSTVSSACNTEERLPIGILPLWLSLGPFLNNICRYLLWSRCSHTGHMFRHSRSCVGSVIHFKLGVRNFE